MSISMEELSYKWLIEQEKSEESKIEKIFGQTFLLETTDKYRGQQQNVSCSETIFQPKWIQGFIGISIFWVLITACVSIATKKVIIQTSIIYGLGFIGFVINLTRHYLKLRNDSRKIKIGKDGIQINNETMMPWSEIILTTILTKPIGRNQRKYLVVVCGESPNSFKRNQCELTDYFSWNQYGFASTLANRIESIKKKSNSY